MKNSSVGIGLVALLGFIAFFFFASEVLIPLVFAFFLFFLLDPLIDALAHFKLSRVFTAPIIVILAFAIFCTAGWGIYGGIAGIADQLPKYSQKIKAVVNSVEERASDIKKDANSIIPGMGAGSSKGGNGAQNRSGSDAGSSDSGASTGSVASTLLHGVGSVFSILTDLFLIPILAVFFLLERDYLRTQFKNSLGTSYPLERVTSEIGSMVKGYFIGNFAVGLITSAIFYGLFLALGLEHKFSLAVFAGFINLIPLFGAVLSPALPTLQAFLQFDTFTSVFVILAASVFLHFFVNNVILPKIVGSRINVNATAATLGLMFWGWLWGASGLLLAIPMTALIRIGLSAHDGTASWALLIAENAGSKKTKKTP